MSQTPLAAAAMRKMNTLLEDHFDTPKGVYKGEYSDERISKETGLALQSVKDYRMGAFGKLLPPSEMFEVTRDLRDLETLFLKMESEMKEKLKDLQARIRNLQKAFD